MAVDGLGQDSIAVVEEEYEERDEGNETDELNARANLFVSDGRTGPGSYATHYSACHDSDLDVCERRRMKSLSQL